MNTLQKTLLALTTGALMTAGANAAVTYGNGYAGQTYLGVKAGQYDVDAEDADEATSYGVYGGYKFTPNFGIEGEYLGTSDETIIDNRLAEVEYSGQVLGLYGTYDYMFPNTGGLYAKGRLGFADNEIEIDAKNKVTGNSGSDTISDTGVAGGLGLGFNISPMASVEAMYNYYPSIEGDDDTEDLDVSGITLGAHLKF